MKISIQNNTTLPWRTRVPPGECHVKWSVQHWHRSCSIHTTRFTPTDIWHPYLLNHLCPQGNHLLSKWCGDQQSYQLLLGCFLVPTSMLTPTPRSVVSTHAVGWEATVNCCFEYVWCLWICTFLWSVSIIGIILHVTCPERSMTVMMMKSCSTFAPVAEKAGIVSLWVWCVCSQVLSSHCGSDVFAARFYHLIVGLMCLQPGFIIALWVWCVCSQVYHLIVGLMCLQPGFIISLWVWCVCSQVLLSHCGSDVFAARFYHLIVGLMCLQPGVIIWL